MSVTGPDFSEDLDNIQAVGTPQRMGSDISSLILLSSYQEGVIDNHMSVQHQMECHLILLAV